MSYQYHEMTILSHNSVMFEVNQWDKWEALPVFLKETMNSYYFINHKGNTTIGSWPAFPPPSQLLDFTWDLFFLGTKRKWVASSTLKLKGLPQGGVAMRMPRGCQDSTRPWSLPDSSAKHVPRRLQVMWSALLVPNCKAGYEHEPALRYKLFVPISKG